MNIKSKRILAWIIDWFICCAIANIFAMALMHNINPISILLCVLVVLACFATFICRDVILTEGSVGKQIFKLQILDSETGGKPSVKQRIVRNIFSLIYPIDGLALLISGQSIGDRASMTFTVCK